MMAVANEITALVASPAYSWERGPPTPTLMADTVFSSFSGIEIVYKPLLHVEISRRLTFSNGIALLNGGPELKMLLLILTEDFIFSGSLDGGRARQHFPTLACNVTTGRHKAKNNLQ